MSPKLMYISFPFALIDIQGQPWYSVLKEAKLVLKGLESWQLN
jgi:hypothetical protein